MTAAAAPQVVWPATELLGATFPPPRWAVPGLLAEGLNLLAGSPKLGKSWWAMNVAVAVATGTPALGSIPVTGGHVLYCSLEDAPPRLQRRLRVLLKDRDAPDRLTFRTALPPLADGGTDELDAWLVEHPGARLVIVDVLARVRESATGNSRYDEDYKLLATLKAIADRHGVCVLVLHHTRKGAQGDDFIAEVSGTYGIAGAADAVLVMQRARASEEARLLVTGRDVEEAAYALRFDAPAGSWTLLDGPAAEHDLTAQRRQVLALLRERGPLGPKQIAEALGIGHDNGKQLVRRMAEAQQLSTDGRGTYSAPLLPVTAVTAVTIPDLWGDTGDVGDSPSGGEW